MGFEQAILLFIQTLSIILMGRGDAFQVLVGSALYITTVMVKL